MTTPATSIPYNSFWRYRPCPQEGPVRPRATPEPPFASLHDPLVCHPAIGGPSSASGAPSRARRGHIVGNVTPNQSP